MGLARDAVERLRRPAFGRAWPLLVLAILCGCADERRPEDAIDFAWLLDVEGVEALDSPVVNREAVGQIREQVAAFSRQTPGVDGGGSLVMLRRPPRVARAAPARFVLQYEAGPAGVAVGGSVELAVSQAWGWSPPVLSDPEAAGFTRITTDAVGMQIRASSDTRGRVRIEIAGRAMNAGERIRIDYGAGPKGAVVDRYSEDAPPFFVRVDGDGDGAAAPLSVLPTVETLPGEPARLLLHLPASARPGEEVALRVALVDAWRNAAPSSPSPVDITDAAGLALPPHIEIGALGEGRATARLVTRVERAGIYRITARSGALVAESNPMVVADAEPRLYWADLHGHSQWSDGTGSPDAYYRYARDVAGLDVSALTDHDHWGPVPLLLRPDRWRAIQEATARFHAPDRFAALLGYEWTSWIHGHRHVLYFDRDERRGRIHSWTAEPTATPEGLWRALAGTSALTIPHHPAGGPIALDWSFEPPPGREPVVEIASVAGSSEAADSPRPVADARPGHFARDVLERGRRLGFIGSGDRHDGHPGVAHGAPPSGGLAGLYASSLSRDALREALVARRVFATNGPRIHLQVSLDGAPMGSVLPGGRGGTQELVVRVIGVAELSHVDIVRRGAAPSRREVKSRRAVLREQIPALSAGDYLYVRAVQRDAGAAWSSPFFGS